MSATILFSESQTYQLQKQPPKVFYKKTVLKNFVKFTGKHLCQSPFFNKVATLFWMRIWHRCFPVKFAKFSRTAFLKKTSGGGLCNSSMKQHLVNIYLFKVTHKNTRKRCEICSKLNAQSLCYKYARNMLKHPNVVSDW